MKQQAPLPRYGNTRRLLHAVAGGRAEKVLLAAAVAYSPWSAVAVFAASAKKSAFCGVISVDADTKYGETGRIAATSVAK